MPTTIHFQKTDRVVSIGVKIVHKITKLAMMNKIKSNQISHLYKKKQQQPNNQKTSHQLPQEPFIKWNVTSLLVWSTFHAFFFFVIHLLFAFIQQFIYNLPDFLVPSKSKPKMKNSDVENKQKPLMIPFLLKTLYGFK